MQIKHNFTKCPKCGNNLEGIEDFCPECGHKLEGQTQQPQHPPPPPQDNQPAAPHKPPPKPGSTASDKKGGFPIWAIMLIIAVVLGGAIGGYFVLKNQGLGSSPNKQNEIQVTKNYYVCYSIAYIGGKQQVAVSNIIVATKKSQDVQWAKNLFKNALKKKFSSKHTKYKQVFAKNFNSMKGATAGSREMKNDYDKKGYQVNTVRINY